MGASDQKPNYLGLRMRNRGHNTCGLCGQYRSMTRAHVPPQSAGNTGEVTKATTVIQAGTLTHGRQRPGGMWVPGLCGDCNSLAGGAYDQAYADYSKSLRPWVGTGRRLAVDPRVPAVTLAPGLVARSVLFGMFAISPNLRTMHPTFADQLRTNAPSLHIPPGLQLRVALTADTTGRLAGPITAVRLLGHPATFSGLAEIFFRPLAWVLTPNEPGLIFDSQRWAVADDWLNYGPDRTTVDLRNLTDTFPLITHPYRSDRDNWIEMYSNDITPIVEGHIPPSAR